MTVYLSAFAGAGAQFFTDDGAVLSGGKIYTYDAGTTTPRATYTSISGTTTNANPIVLDSGGRLPEDMWLAEGVKYRFVLTDSNDVQIGEYDDIAGVNDISTESVAWSTITGTPTTLAGYGITNGITAATAAATYAPIASPTFTITPSAISGNITLTASSATTDTGTAQAGSSDTITLKSSSSFTTDDQPNGMFVVLTSGTGAGQTRHVEDYVASTKVATIYPAWTTPPNSTTGYKVVPFAETTVGEFAQVKTGFGRVRYVEYVSDTVMKAVTVVPFFDTSGIVSGDWESEHGYEPTWSATRGWPRSATFHQNRLYFGGAKQRTNTIWGSRVINYFDFDPGTGLDDEGLEATIATDQYNAITRIVSQSDLRIFSTGGEFIISNGEGQPLTPSSFIVRPQTRLGAKAGVPIEDLNGASIFVQRSGQSLNAFQFTDRTASYQVTPISVLSSHLIKNPVDLAIRRGTSTDETDTLYVVNGEDGSMTAYSILSSQGVIAASEFTTGINEGDEFIAVASEIDTVYVIVKRIINATTKYYLEKFDYNRCVLPIDNLCEGITWDELNELWKLVAQQWAEVKKTE